MGQQLFLFLLTVPLVASLHGLWSNWNPPGPHVIDGQFVNLSTNSNTTLSSSQVHKLGLPEQKVTIVDRRQPSGLVATHSLLMVECSLSAFDDITQSGVRWNDLIPDGIFDCFAPDLETGRVLANLTIAVVDTTEARIHFTYGNVITIFRYLVVADPRWRAGPWMGGYYFWAKANRGGTEEYFDAFRGWITFADPFN